MCSRDASKQTRFFSSEQILVASIAATPVAGVFLFLVNRYRKERRIWWLFVAVLAVLSLPWLPVFIPLLNLAVFGFLAILLMTIYLNEKSGLQGMTSRWAEVVLVCLGTHVFLFFYIQMTG